MVQALDDVYYGCANQAGEDNRNVARMALLLAGLPESIPGIAVNRLCWSGLNAVGLAAAAIRAGESDFAIAGGAEIHDAGAAGDGQGAGGVPAQRPGRGHHLGWRFINPLMKQQYGVDAMPETRPRMSPRTTRSRGATRTHLRCVAQQRAAKAQAAGFFGDEIVAVTVPGGRAGPLTVEQRRTPAARHHRGGARQAQAVRARVPAR